MKKKEECLFHGEQCWNYTEKAKLEDFDLVFAYEGLARAYNLMGDNEKYKEYFDMGVNSLDQVKKKDDRDYCISELNWTLSGYWKRVVSY